MITAVGAYLDAIASFDEQKKLLESSGTTLTITTARDSIRAHYLDVQDELWKSNIAWMICAALEKVGYSLKNSYTQLDQALVLKDAPLEPLPESGVSQKDFNDAASKLNPQAFPHPNDFKLGVGTCEYQLSGFKNCPDSQWHKHELKYTDTAHQSNQATNHWKIPVAEEVERIKALGVTAYRFSVEWSLIEPEQGTINQDAITHYSELCDALIKEGIDPCITLHHFSHPQWFEDLGAFEKEENIDYFVNFSKMMYERLGDRVQTWFTINEPNIYAAMGYHGLFDTFPPGKMLQIGTMMRVLANLFRAHDRVYDMIHSTYHSNFRRHEGARAPKVGFVHQMLRFKPRFWFDPIRLFGKYMNFVFCHDRVMHFARTGEFSYSCPGFGSVRYVTEGGPKSDFIGINYYTVPLMQSWSQPMAKCEGEEFTDMDFRTHPTGLYLGLREVHTLGQEIMVTENGIADSRDDRRAKFIREHLLAIQKSLGDRVNLSGYFYWSLMDNSEWRHGIGVKNFGLYAINWETFERTLRKGAQAFVDFAKSWQAFYSKSSTSSAA